MNPREVDRLRYHAGPNGSQGGGIGIEGPDGLTYCVGCRFCCPDEDTLHYLRHNYLTRVEAERAHKDAVAESPLAKFDRVWAA